MYLCADGGGRVETATHPDTGERVWSCSSCTARGKGEEQGREHAAGCATVRNTFQNHFN
ncbi:Zn-finger protein [Streptomyces sp. V3I8]|uniref:hypothetical protein n=1 Tax=Streptomyces sp. V3I8 TaxID=3042279 RepID=UPI0027866E1D|nr:hypothetical protein [Streptomyces sp. V3I8]MDQ1039437.1 Zn-finger protein [Streptomyces sp. V3I8]